MNDRIEHYIEGVEVATDPDTAPIIEPMYVKKQFKLFKIGSS